MKTSKIFPISPVTVSLDGLNWSQNNCIYVQIQPGGSDMDVVSGVHIHMPWLSPTPATC